MVGGQTWQEAPFTIFLLFGHLFVFLRYAFFLSLVLIGGIVFLLWNFLSFQYFYTNVVFYLFFDIFVYEILNLIFRQIQFRLDLVNFLFILQKIVKTLFVLLTWENFNSLHCAIWTLMIDSIFENLHKVLIYPLSVKFFERFVLEMSPGI